MQITITTEEMALIYDALACRHGDIERESHKATYTNELRKHHAKWAQELAQIINKLSTKQ